MLKKTLNDSRGRAGGATWLGVGCLAGTLGLLVVLKTLDYSSVRLVPVEAAEANARPTPDFRIGPLTWPVAELSRDPRLEPFRRAFRSACGDARGRAAAACASAVLAERIPLGEPKSEFVSPHFDPVAHFEEHMAGAPGHCLTRSAILATQLLSVGIPARVVQLVPPQGKGHTLVGFWDERSGWLVVDPTTSGFVTWDGKRGSAPDLLTDPRRVRWTPLDSSQHPRAETADRKRELEALLSGVVLYPEPWLYLRNGKPAAPWPFHGYYARVGPTVFRLGPAQAALCWAAAGLTVTGLCILAVGRRRRPTGQALRTAACSGGAALGALDTAPPA